MPTKKTAAYLFFVVYHPYTNIGSNYQLIDINRSALSEFCVRQMLLDTDNQVGVLFVSPNNLLSLYVGKRCFSNKEGFSPDTEP